MGGMMEQMMSNPGMMEMAQKMMGGGGGNMMEMAQKMMGGGGGGMPSGMKGMMRKGRR